MRHKPLSGPNREPRLPARTPDALSFRAAEVQRLRRLVRDPERRREERAFVLEGPTLVDEALGAATALESVFADVGCDHAVLDRAHAAGVPIRRVLPGVIERVSDTVTPQPIMAISPAVDVDIRALCDATLLVVSAGVSDPGNLGTLLRVAEAAGADGVLCCAGSVDVYNPKAVRASAGSLFHVPVVVGGDPGQVLSELGAWGVRRLATRPRGGSPYTETDLTRRVALVLGNEAHGLDGELDAVVDEDVSIPMVGRTESLNVAMAAAVLVFEAARQRRAA